MVGILDKGRTADGSFFLVMDFVEGTDLNTYARRLGKDTAAIIRLFVKVASAVDEAHQLGIVHRDLKPMNILVDSRGEPHVLDFGMARVLYDLGSVSEPASEQASLTQTGQVLGSLPWTSPEQVFGSPDAVDAQCDVYALGVMLFTTLAGEFPYPVIGGPRAISYHVANTPPASLTRLAQRNGMTVTAGLEEIVYEALSKSPGERYASAGLFARDLEAWLEGKPRSIAQIVGPAALVADSWHGGGSCPTVGVRSALDRKPACPQLKNSFYKFVGNAHGADPRRCRTHRRPRSDKRIRPG